MFLFKSSICCMRKNLSSSLSSSKSKSSISMSKLRSSYCYCIIFYYILPLFTTSQLSPALFGLSSPLKFYRLLALNVNAGTASVFCKPELTWFCLDGLLLGEWFWFVKESDFLLSMVIATLLPTLCSLTYESCNL